MLRRFFKCLEQGIERALGEHMDLVYDVHLISCGRRGKVDLLRYLPDVINAVVGSGIHLDDVEDAAVKDTFAGRALVARVAAHGVLAVHGSREDLGYRGLTRSVLSAEEIRMTDPAISDRLTKRSNGFLLFNDIVERLRSEPSVQRQVFFHGYSPLNRKSPSRPKCKQIRLPRGTRGNPLTAASFRT